MIYDTIILGAGASGLMCAASLPKKHKTLLIDTNEKIGTKIKISGGGRCNVTNSRVSERNYLGESSFVKGALERFSQSDLLEFIKQNGCVPKLEKGRFYFCPKSAQQLIDIFAKLTKKHTFLLGTDVFGVEKKSDLFSVTTSKGSFRARSVVVATGGESFKNLGATKIALEIAQSFGIAYTPFRPALVGFTLQKEQFWFKALSGVSIDVKIELEQKTIRGSLLFAHKGITGPAVLNASLYWKKGLLKIDFLPNIDLGTILKDGKKKYISSILPLPKRFSKAFLEHLGITDKECMRLTKNEIVTLTKELHSYCFAPAGTFGFSKAEVSAGGIDTNELTQHFEAKKIKKLHFIGEAVDITGELGGYNFQWAFSSGKICADFVSLRTI